MPYNFINEDNPPLGMDIQNMKEKAGIKYFANKKLKNSISSTLPEALCAKMQISQSHVFLHLPSTFLQLPVIHATPKYQNLLFSTHYKQSYILLVKGQSTQYMFEHLTRSWHTNNIWYNWMSAHLFQNLKFRCIRNTWIYQYGMIQ